MRQQDANRNTIGALSRLTGIPSRLLLALHPSNDPFWRGTVRQNQHVEWFMALAEQHRGRGLGIRDLHYALIVVGAAYDENIGKNEWSRLQRAAGFARDLGVIPPWEFPDKRTRLLAVDGRRDLGEAVTVKKPSLWVPSQTRQFGVEIEEFSALRLQPVRVLVLLEKDAEGVVEEVLPPCTRQGAELRITTGFTPKTLAGEVCREAVRDGRPIYVFQITDADSKGEQMAIATSRHIEFIRSRHDVPPVTLDRIALTLAQVAEIEEDVIGRSIPRSPDKSERREGRVELNALPIFAPGWLRGQVEQALDSVTVEIEEPDPPDVPDELQEFIDKGERLGDRLLARVGERLRLIDQIVSDEIADWEPEEIEVEVPELEVPEDFDPILGSDRNYEEQINAYRRHGAAHRDLRPLDFAPRTCALPGCERTMLHRSVQARYCSTAHMRQAKRKKGRA